MAVGPIIQGFTYQTLIFWIKSCKLLIPKENIKEVSFEANDKRSFDDVKVEYETEIDGDSNTPKIKFDYFQVKFHTHPKLITMDNLIDPAFVNASKHSILQRLKKAVASQKENNSRFYFLSPSVINPEDRLYKLVNTNGQFNLEKLFEGKTKTSQMFQLRDCLKQHLKVGDEELKVIFKAFRLVSIKNYDQTYDHFNDSLSAAGLKRLDTTQRQNPYESIYNNLLRKGQNTFTRESLKKIMTEENLIENKNSSKSRDRLQYEVLLDHIKRERIIDIIKDATGYGNNPSLYIIETNDKKDLINFVDQESQKGLQDFDEKQSYYIYEGLINEIKEFTGYLWAYRPNGQSGELRLRCDINKREDPDIYSEATQRAHEHYKAIDQAYDKLSDYYENNLH
ncbi:hypothetical protein [Bacillus sp. WC2507]|uniref:hypothetical protein n=1 Tax=Bacillus sp. WC2507 TaxID=3461404 RepID=UPI004041BED3